MGRAERVVGGLGPLGEARQPVLLTQCIHAVPPPRQNLVGIALVRHVPDQLVARRLENGVQRDR